MASSLIGIMSAAVVIGYAKKASMQIVAQYSAWNTRAGDISKAGSPGKMAMSGAASIRGARFGWWIGTEAMTMPLQHRGDPMQQVQDLVNAARPLFAGREPAIIGAALADLLAMWLAGHIGPEQDQVREEILKEHIECVRSLIPINEEIILGNKE